LRGQTLDEFLGFHDVKVTKAREARRHRTVERLIERCMNRNGLEYTQVPFQESAVDTTSPAEYARVSGFGISASYLGDGSENMAEMAHDPNVPYIESLGAEARSRYFATHANCANAASDNVNAPVEAAAAKVAPFVDAAYARLKRTPEYTQAMDGWSRCIAASTGISAERHDDFKGQAFARFVPAAQALAAKNDVDGLRSLRQDEIRVASAAAACEGERRQVVEPVIRQHESVMIAEHVREFSEYRSALEMSP
jgi:hypothetical protein